MSKIGKKPIKLPGGTTVEVSGKTLSAKGTKGVLEIKLPENLKVKVEDGSIFVSAQKNDRETISMWGTIAKIISNMVNGVSEGWQKQLEIIGTGYRAEVQGNTLILTVGYSHPVKIEAPENISFSVAKNVITVFGIDRQVVGQIAAEIRKVRPPEPYKGKGIKYIDEVIRRKAGKAAKAAA